MLVHVEMQGVVVSVEVDDGMGLNDLKARVREAAGLPENQHVTLMCGDEDMLDDSDITKLDDGETIKMSCGRVIKRRVAHVLDTRSRPGENGRLTYIDDTQFEAPGQLTAIRAEAKTFRDQGWGGQKGHVFVVKCPGGVRPDSYTSALCTTLLGVTPRIPEGEDQGQPRFRLTEGQKCMQVAVGDQLVLAYTVGGDGGHRLEVEDLTALFSFDNAPLPEKLEGVREL